MLWILGSCAKCKNIVQKLFFGCGVKSAPFPQLTSHLWHVVISLASADQIKAVLENQKWRPACLQNTDCTTFSQSVMFCGTKNKYIKTTEYNRFWCNMMKKWNFSERAMAMTRVRAGTVIAYCFYHWIFFWKETAPPPHTHTLFFAVIHQTFKILPFSNQHFHAAACADGFECGLCDNCIYVTALCCWREEI